MPYVIEETQKMIDEILDQMENSNYTSIWNWTAGEVNCFITKLLLRKNPERYAHFNEIIGILECCKLEFYRRAVAAYEDEKIEQNGDVY